MSVSELPATVRTGEPPAGWSELVTSGIFESLAFGADPFGDRVINVAARMEHLGAEGVESGLLFTAATHLASTITPVARFGSEAQRERMLPLLSSGEFIGSHAITEQNAGSDVMAMRATVRHDGDDLVLNADKLFTTNGPIATHTVVYARTVIGSESRGITAYLVPNDGPGLTRGTERPVSSFPASPIGSMTWRDYSLPSDAVIGRVGAGMQVLDFVMKREILFAFSADVGRIARRVRDLVQFVNAREQFGAPLAEHQSVATAVADQYIASLSARAVLHEAARALRSGRDATKEIGAAKILISELNVSTSLAAVNLRGGCGLDPLAVHSADVLDALAGTIYSGSNLIQKTRIAAMLGLRTRG